MNHFLKASLLIFCLFILVNNAKATHIVGGEFEMVHQDGFNYTFNTVLYFDEVNGNPGAKDNFVLATIFNKRTNAFVRQITMNFVQEENVPYTNIDCAIGELRTSRLFYTTTVFLSPDTFNEPEGYYLVWERCCRNNTITNVVLTAPNTVGQTFYMEFPPVVDSTGAPFINSSPVLFPPLSDYACVGEYYYVDFAGSDPDGDSIVYSMVTPLHTSTLQAVPIPTPAPHPDVPWKPGINVDNQIPGYPSLSVSKTGFLTVTPSFSGLFVFAVKAEEFRDGVKIGEVRRDFQMLVIDCPDVGSPPGIFAKVKGSPQLYTEGQVITFRPDDEQRCLELFVQDIDVPENIRIVAKPVNFNTDISEILSLNSGFVLNKDDTLKAEVCFPLCPYTANQPMLIDLIAYDDACSLPLSDTIRIAINVIPPENHAPTFVAPINDLITKSVTEGETFTLPIKATDEDGDPLFLSFIPDSFVMEDVGMRFSQPVAVDGEINSTFTWETGCDIYDFTQQTDFELMVLVGDFDACQINARDTLKMSLHVILPDNTDPIVTSDLSATFLSAELNNLINFNVFGNDADNDSIKLEMVTKGFSADAYGITFPEAVGKGSTSSPFNWNLDCRSTNLDTKDEFTFYFIATDKDKCKFPNADTLEVVIKLFPPKNVPPQVSLQNKNAQDTIKIAVGSTLTLDILGLDPDGDSIFLTLMDRGKYEGLDFTFDDVAGVGFVKSPLTWIPSCQNLADQMASNEAFTFRFLGRDNYCIAPTFDTLTVTVFIKDVFADFDKFQPPNIFTPNGDGKNDFFRLSDWKEEKFNIPPDNCVNQFKEISIYNRYGKRVFHDNRRTFTWHGKGMSTGVYYYSLKFTNAEYNGTVSILF